MPATATKPKKKDQTDSKPEEKSEEVVEKTDLDEQIEVFEPVPKAVDRVLKHPDTGEEKHFIQHEMSFLTKLKFFRLLSGTVRLASSEEGGSAELIQELLGGVSQAQSDSEIANEFLGVILRLVELVPDFIEESYVYALNVKPEDEIWFSQALQVIDDEQGVDILEVFVAQNGQAVRNFFDKHLKKMGQRLTQELQLGQESETTT